MMFRRTVIRSRGVKPEVWDWDDVQSVCQAEQQGNQGTSEG